METLDLKNKTVQELHELLAGARETSRKYKFQALEMQLKKVHLIRQSRQLIARILTILHTK